MSKSIFTFILVFLTVCSFGTEPTNEWEYKADFKALESVEQYLEKHPGADLEKMKATTPELVRDLDSFDASTVFITDADTVIPPFWWGFCLGVWGILIVLIITDKDKSAVNKAFKGCLVSGAMIAAVYVILIITGLGLTGIN